MSNTFRIIDGVGWIGERAFPFAEVDKEDHEYEYEYKVRRMRVPAENGWTMSIIWGSYTYSDNHDFPGFAGDGRAVWIEESQTAEIRIYGRHGRDALEDQVAGYLPPDQVLGLLHTMSTWATDEKPCITEEMLRDYHPAP